MNNEPDTTIQLHHKNCNCKKIRNFTDEELINTMIQHLGNKTHTAKALNTSRNTVFIYSRQLALPFSTHTWGFVEIQEAKRIRKQLQNLNKLTNSRKDADSIANIEQDQKISIINQLETKEDELQIAKDNIIELETQASSERQKVDDIEDEKINLYFKLSGVCDYRHVELCTHKGPDHPSCSYEICFYIH